MAKVNVVYKTTVTATGGRAGRAKSGGGVIDMPLVMPKELSGPGGKGANPEQLFAAGYAACFETALRFLALQQKKNITDASATATVGVGPRDAGGFGLTVELTARIKGVSKADAEQLTKAAHEMVCPYSHTTRGNVDVAVKAEAG